MLHISLFPGETGPAAEGCHLKVADIKCLTKMSLWPEIALSFRQGRP